MTHKARKRFGQNFLVDEQAISRCISSIAPKAGELIFEIGPGQEALTRPLAESGADLTVVEIDRDLAARLVAAGRPYRVINQDALKTGFADLAGSQEYRLVGNLPYNISTPLLFHLLDQQPPPRDMHFMLQREVVKRMYAGPGGKDFGRLSLTCQNLCEVTPLFDVPAEAFEPRPKVESSFVRLTPREQPLVDPALRTAFETVVAQAFSMRRKTLRNSLRKMLQPEDFESTGIDPSLRPEQLDIEGFIRIAKSLAD